MFHNNTQLSKTKRPPGGRAAQGYPRNLMDGVKFPPQNIFTSDKSDLIPEITAGRFISAGIRCGDGVIFNILFNRIS